MSEHTSKTARLGGRVLWYAFCVAITIGLFSLSSVAEKMGMPGYLTAGAIGLAIAGIVHWKVG